MVTGFSSKTMGSAKLDATVLKGKVAFILEDDINNLAIISSILSRSGISIHFDTWGKETPYQIKRFMPIDFILLDMMLPQGVSGYDVFDDIRSTPELTEIPIIAISAMDASTEAPKTREKGFAGFISKPVRTRTLVKAIIKILEGGDVWGEYE